MNKDLKLLQKDRKEELLASNFYLDQLEGNSDDA
jgi:hypothetical protein